MVNPSSKLVERSKGKRDSAEAKIQNNLDDEEEMKAPSFFKDTTLDQLLPEDDPSNYLHQLENPDEAKE